MQKSQHEELKWDHLCFAYHANLNNLITQYSLSKNDIRCLIFIVDNFQYGNIAFVTSKAISICTGIQAEQVARAVNRLKKYKILVAKNGATFLNQRIVSQNYGFNHEIHSDKPRNGDLIRGFHEHKFTFLGDWRISQRAMNCLYCILDFFEKGNLVFLPISAISAKLGISAYSVSQNLKRIKEAKLLVEKDSVTYLNQDIFKLKYV